MQPGEFVEQRYGTDIIDARSILTIYLSATKKAASWMIQIEAAFFYIAKLIKLISAGAYYQVYASICQQVIFDPATILFYLPLQASLRNSDFTIIGELPA